MNIYPHDKDQVTLLYPLVSLFDRSFVSLKFIGAGRGHVLRMQYFQNACCFMRIALAVRQNLTDV